MKKNLKEIPRIMTVLAVLTIAAGCGQPVELGGTEGTEPTTEQVQETAETVVDDASGHRLALCKNSVNIFQTYYSLNSPSKNTLIAPVSLQCALALLMDASEVSGTVRDELTRFYQMSSDELEQSIQSLIGSQVESAGNKFVMANTVWLNDWGEDRKFRQSYVDTVDEKYFATPNSSDLSTIEGIDEVNMWVADNTLGIIDSLLDTTTDSQALLINAIGFDCKWMEPFSEIQEDTDFYVSPENIVKVDMLSSYGKASYIEADNYEGIKIEYAPVYTQSQDISNYSDASRFSFVALKPKGISLSDLIYRLDEEDIDNIIHTDNASEYTVDLLLPKFNISDTLQLNELLQTMGVTSAFNPYRAQFNIYEGSQNRTYLTDVVQKAVIEVSENGTKAAAVTAAALQDNAVAANTGQVKEMTFDEPFVYMITDNMNGVPLFIGTLINPVLQE